MIVQLAGRDPLVYVRAELSDPQAVMDGHQQPGPSSSMAEREIARHRQQLQLLVDALVEAWWRPMFPQAHANMAATMMPDAACGGSAVASVAPRTPLTYNIGSFSY